MFKTIGALLNNMMRGQMTGGVIVTTEDNDNGGWDLHPPPDTHVMVRDATMPLSPPTNDSDDNDKSVTFCQINDMLPT